MEFLRFAEVFLFLSDIVCGLSVCYNKKIIRGEYDGV